MAAINPFPIKELRQLKPRPVKGLDINKGTLEFKARERFPWDASKLNILMNVCEEDNVSNNVATLIDKSNMLNVVYNSIDPNRALAQIKYDVSKINKAEPHYVVVTWSLENKEIILYFDGKPVVKESIKIIN